MELWERLKAATVQWARAKETFARGQLRTGIGADGGIDLAGADLERILARQAYRDHKRTAHGEDLIIAGDGTTPSRKTAGSSFSEGSRSNPSDRMG